MQAQLRRPGPVERGRLRDGLPDLSTQPFSLGLPGGGVTDLRKAPNLNNLDDPELPTPPVHAGTAGSGDATRFTAGVTEPGGIDFPLLEPANDLRAVPGQAG